MNLVGIGCTLDVRLQICAVVSYIRIVCCLYGS